ncbi:Hexosyltransferase [Psidium guajava]|nr:Hexosyltransferase [Psidium guajava]
MNDRDGDGSSLEWIDEELTISDEDASVDTEPLSGPDDDDFEETNVETRHIVNRYNPVHDHGENMFTLGYISDRYLGTQLEWTIERRGGIDRHGYLHELELDVSPLDN